MAEPRVDHLAGEAIVPFHKSFTERYERWKRTDLISVAMETMPKQVKKNKVLRNLAELNKERLDRLNAIEEI